MYLLVIGLMMAGCGGGGISTSDAPSAIGSRETGGAIERIASDGAGLWDDPDRIVVAAGRATGIALESWDAMVASEDSEADPWYAVGGSRQWQAISPLGLPSELEFFVSGDKPTSATRFYLEAEVYDVHNRSKVMVAFRKAVPELFRRLGLSSPDGLLQAIESNQGFRELMPYGMVVLEPTSYLAVPGGPGGDEVVGAILTVSE